MSAAKPMLFMNVPLWLYASFYFVYFIQRNGYLGVYSLYCLSVCHISVRRVIIVSAIIEAFLYTLQLCSCYLIVLFTCSYVLRVK